MSPSASRARHVNCAAGLSALGVPLKVRVASVNTSPAGMLDVGVKVWRTLPSPARANGRVSGRMGVPCTKVCASTRAAPKVGSLLASPMMNSIFVAAAVILP